MTTSQQIYTSRMNFLGTAITSVGVTDANKIIKTNSAGDLDNSFLSFNGQIVIVQEYYPNDIIWVDDGTANNVTVRDGFDITNKKVYKECIGGAGDQDLDLILTCKLPSQFVEFSTDAIQIESLTSSATTTTSTFDLEIWRNTSSLYTLSNFGSSLTWVTNTINKTSLAASVAGNVLTLIIKAKMDLAAYCRLGVVRLSYLRSI